MALPSSTCPWAPTPSTTTNRWGSPMPSNSWPPTTHVLVVAAAGNSGSTTPTWPSAFPGVISVGALRPDQPADWSNHGAAITIWTIGEGILSTFVLEPRNPGQRPAPAAGSSHPPGGHRVRHLVRGSADRRGHRPAGREPGPGKPCPSRAHCAGCGAVPDLGPEQFPGHRLVCRDGLPVTTVCRGVQLLPGIPRLELVSSPRPRSLVKASVKTELLRQGKESPVVSQTESITDLVHRGPTATKRRGPVLWIATSHW